MIEFRPDDFVPLGEFPRAWRFTDPRWDDLPADERARLRPVSADKAAELAPVGAALCRRSGGALALRLRTTGSADEVRAWLAGLGKPTGAEVIVSWDAACALLAPWGVFAAHWDAFCYPSSDEVTVWPADASWWLCYEHDEWFVFQPPVA